MRPVQRDAVQDRRPSRARGSRSAGCGRTGRPAERTPGLDRSAGRNDGAPSMVVLFDSARSAEPPHELRQDRGDRVDDLAGRLAGGDALASAGNTGSASPSRPAAPAACSRSQQRGPLGVRRRQAANDSCHSACRPARRAHRPRGRGRAPRRTTSKDFVGVEAEQPPWSRRPRRRRAPQPCALPVFCAVGAGQPMIVRSAMNEGRSVSARAAVSAAANAATSTLAVGASRRSARATRTRRSGRAGPR